jgi:lipoate-protein ligase B
VGVRIEHGVSYHGIALNVSVALPDFDLIDACGMPGVESTSVDRELGVDAPPSTDSVATAANAFARALAEALRAPLTGELPPGADPVAARQRLEGMLLAPPAGVAGGR